MQPFSNLYSYSQMFIANVIVYNFIEYQLSLDILHSAFLQYMWSLGQIICYGTIAPRTIRRRGPN